MEDETSAQIVQGSSRSFDGWVEHWAGEIQAVQRHINNRTLLVWIGIGLAAIIILFVGMGLFGRYAWIALVLLIPGIAGGVVLFNRATKFRKNTVQKLAGEIQQICQSAGLAREEVVEELSQKTKGQVSQEVLKVVDPNTVALLNIRARGEEFFKRVSSQKISPMQISVSASSGRVTKVTVQGEQNVDRFSAIAVDYLMHKGYVEGIAALAMVQMLYIEIAPPAGESFIKASQSNPALKDVALNAHKIMSGFDFNPEMKAVKETLAKRYTKSFLDLILLAQQQQVSLDDTSLTAALDSTRLKVRHEAFVGACIDYIGKHTTDIFKRNRSYELLARIPDARTLPYLMDAFKQLFFFPQGIEAVALLGEEAHPKLLEALRTGSSSLRFNAALALGFMNVAAAKLGLEEVLPAITAPMERAGVCYALVRLGEAGHLSTIVDTLDHPNNDVRHTAAIALEHLTEPLSDEVYLKHLNDGSMLVRLRLIRKLGAQGTETPVVIDALAERFDDTSEDVRSAAVTSMAGLSAELVYDRMVELVNGGKASARLCAYEVLGKLSQSQAEPLLTNALSKTYDNDVRRTVLSALGELGAVEAADQIAHYLDDDDLSNAAFWALLRISLADKEAGIKPFHRSKHKVKELFLLSLHGDEQAKTQLKGMLSSSKDFLTLIQAMEYAQILRDPYFEASLRQLLTYRKPDRFPGDRYVSYMALKALTHIQLAKV